jgi:hypothetical protein
MPSTKVCKRYMASRRPASPPAEVVLPDEVILETASRVDSFSCFLREVLLVCQLKSVGMSSYRYLTNVIRARYSLLVFQRSIQIQTLESGRVVVGCLGRSPGVPDM